MFTSESGGDSNEEHVETRRIDKYDGQTVSIDGKAIFELGNYLGGGISGSVHSAIDLRVHPEEKSVAVKILNPVGFKLFPSAQLGKCRTLHKGSPITLDQYHGKTSISVENIWWIMHTVSRQIIAAFEDPMRGQLKELTLPRCVEVWGWNPKANGQCLLSVCHEEESDYNTSTTPPNIASNIEIPVVAPKYLNFLRSRRQICREMGSMMKLGGHQNIVELYEVLEFVQDSKSTLFLIMELVTGGELFERMKNARGMSEQFSRRYFKQLLSGIDYCHGKGVAHRDLKPENLLLSDMSDEAILKIADFGLSTGVFAKTRSNSVDIQDENDDVLIQSFTRDDLISSSQNKICQENPSLRYNNKAIDNKAVDDDKKNTYTKIDYDIDNNKDIKISEEELTIKRLRSVVGSPHYVAPEISSTSINGYDGFKVDMWSSGVILYGLLTGVLPFGKELTLCPRYRKFKEWIYCEYSPAIEHNKEPSYPQWLFPSHLRPACKSLLTRLLHPDPKVRPLAVEALKDPWFCPPSNSSCSVGRECNTNYSNEEKGNNVHVHGTIFSHVNHKMPPRRL